MLSQYRDEVKSIKNLTTETAKETLEKVSLSLGIKTGQILQALRMVITGGASGPDLMMTLEILGPFEVEKRISYALGILKKK